MHEVSKIFVSQMAIRDEVLLSALKEVWDRSNKIIIDFEKIHGKKLKKLQNYLITYALYKDDVSLGNSIFDFVKDNLKSNEFKCLSRYYEASSLVKSIKSDILLVKKEIKDDAEDLDISLTGEMMNNLYFVKSVVPSFFELQYISFDLLLANEGLNPIGSLEGINSRRVIAKSGGVAKNYGIKVLQELVLKKIYEIEVKEKFENKNKFFKKYEDCFLDVLNNYQRNFLGKRDDFGKIIGYGSDLTQDGFILKMKSWASTPVFLNAMKRHLTEKS